MSEKREHYFNCYVEGQEPEQITLYVGSHQVVTIEKEFGPTIFAPLRIRITVGGKAEWISERQGGDEKWAEVAKVPAQIESDFEETETP
jgi:hypothetical protein